MRQLNCLATQALTPAHSAGRLPTGHLCRAGCIPARKDGSNVFGRQDEEVLAKPRL